MHAETDTDHSEQTTVLERLARGEAVPFADISNADRLALVPDFAERWRQAMRDVQTTAQGAA